MEVGPGVDINAVIPFALPRRCPLTVTDHPETGHENQQQRCNAAARPRGPQERVFRVLSAHTGGSASCDSATPHRAHCPEGPAGAPSIQRHCLPARPTLTSASNSPAILKLWQMHHCSPVLLLLCAPGMPFLLCPTPESSQAIPAVEDC